MTAAPARQLGALLRSPALRYLAVGGCTFAADLLLLVALHGGLGLALPIATALAYVMATGGNFLLNRSFTFGTDQLAGPAGRYAILVGVNLLISVVVVPALTYGLGWDYRLAKVSASLAAVLWNYVAYRLWVFT